MYYLDVIPLRIVELSGPGP